MHDSWHSKCSNGFSEKGVCCNCSVQAQQPVHDSWFVLISDDAFRGSFPVVMHDTALMSVFLCMISVSVNWGHHSVINVNRQAAGKSWTHRASLSVYLSAQNLHSLNITSSLLLGECLTFPYHHVIFIIFIIYIIYIYLSTLTFGCFWSFFFFVCFFCDVHAVIG